MTAGTGGIRPAKSRPTGLEDEAVHPGTCVPRRFSGVVFDLDGVLLDTERLSGIVEARLCRRLGYEYGLADQAATLGLDPLEACRYYARRFGLSDADAEWLAGEFEEMMREELDHESTPLPGAVELVKRLRGSARLAVASNSRRATVDLAMTKSGMTSSFDVVISADDVRNPKPAPDPYRRACDLLGILPHEGLALEDTLVGATSALAAGLECFGIMPRDLPPGFEVSRRVSSLTELLSAEP